MVFGCGDTHHQPEQDDTSPALPEDSITPSQTRSTQNKDPDEMLQHHTVPPVMG
jgi:hypothetical protein